MKLIILDDSRDMMARARRAIAGALPDIEVTEYDIEDKGAPPASFEWVLYDAVILAESVHQPDLAQTILTLASQRPDFPPVLLVRAPEPASEARVSAPAAAACLEREELPTLRTVAVLDRLMKAAGARPAPRQDYSVYQRALPLLTTGTPDGRTIGYRFVRLIGQGEASRVYLAERAASRATLVLKIIDLSRVREQQVVQRFCREATLLATLESRHVVKFLDHGFTAEYGYIAMEFFTRGDLKQRIEQGVSESDAINYVLHLAIGLEAVHAAGVVHRDIKPGNVMFRADDSLAIADFGISRRIDDNTRLTRRGNVLGTPNYLSPEQALGRHADHRADLYCAGVILFELLTGHKPFHADSASGLLYQHVHAALPRLPLPLKRYQTVLDGLLAKRPEDRIPTAADLVREVMALVD